MLLFCPFCSQWLSNIRCFCCRFSISIPHLSYRSLLFLWKLQYESSVGLHKYALGQIKPVCFMNLLLSEHGTDFWMQFRTKRFPNGQHAKGSKVLMNMLLVLVANDACTPSFLAFFTTQIDRQWPSSTNSKKSFSLHTARKPY